MDEALWFGLGLLCGIWVGLMLPIVAGMGIVRRPRDPGQPDQKPTPPPFRREAPKPTPPPFRRGAA